MLTACGLVSQEPASAGSVHESWYAAIDRIDAKKDDLKRCEDYPAPVGYSWSKDLVRVLCADQWAPVAQAAVVEAMIQRQDWRGLHAHYSGYLRRHYAKTDPERLLFRAFPVASWKSPEEADTYTRRWLKAAPADPYANTLRAKILLRQAWDARGTALSKDVPPERMQRMQGLAREAQRLAAEAARREPRLLPAYEMMLEVAALTGDRPLLAKALDDAVRQSPEGYYVRETALNFLPPKWGGSFQEMDRLVESAQPHVDANPRLQLLRVHQASWKGDRLAFDNGQWGPALDVYRVALALAPEDDVIEAAAYTAAQVGRNAEAVMLWSQALRFSRNHVYGYTSRGLAWEQLSELPRAHRDYAAAAALAPEDPEPPFRMAALEHRRQNLEAAERYYLQALALDPDHAESLIGACRLWVHLTLEPRKAKPYAERLTALRPDDPDSWLLLANIHHSLGDPAVHVSARRFLALAAPDDPRWKNSVEIIQRFLASQATEQQR